MADEFVRKDVFDANMRRMETLMEKNLAKHESIAVRLEGKIDTLNQRIDGMSNTLNQRIDGMANTLNQRIDGMANTLTERMNTTIAQYNAFANNIEGDVKAINARFDTLQSRFAWNLAWVGIIMGLVLTVIQRLWK